MKRLLSTFILLLVAVAGLSAASFSTAEPRANEKAVVLAGSNARFTVLTPQLIRMEWSEDGVFEDRASLAFINRNLEVPQFKVTKTAKKVVIKTSDVTLTYLVGNVPFNEANLKVEFLTAGQKTVQNSG